MPVSRPWIATLIIGIVVWLGLFFIIQQLLAPPRDFDFSPRWVGCRALFNGDDPYSPAVTDDIQMAMFGQLLPPDFDQNAFAYSANVCLSPFAPLWLLPRRTAAIAWATTQFIAYVLMLMVVMPRLFNAKPPLIVLALTTMLGTIGFIYPIETVLIAQPTPLALFSTVWVMVMLERDQPVLASLGMTGVFIRPEGMLIGGFILMLAWVRQQRHFVYLTVLLMSLSYAIVALWIGWDWVLIWVEALRVYQDYALPFWIPSLLGTPLNLMLVLGLFVWAGWMFQRIRGMPSREQDWWGLSVVILLAMVLVPQTRSYTLIWGLIPVSVTLWSVSRGWVTWLLFGCVMLSSWLTFILRTDLQFHARTGDLLALLLMIGMMIWQIRQSSQIIPEIYSS